jgi:hypothetical protein
VTASSAARRLAVAFIALVAVDLFVPGIRDRLEAARYEQRGNPTRFENSDFFALGPMTQYLREHPDGRQLRTAFIGNSVSFGYGLDVRDTVPAVYERLSPGEKVFNLSVNGLDLGSAYLIAKSVMDSVDTVFLLSRPGLVNDALANVIPVSPDDLQRFNLRVVATPSLAPLAMRWRLYRDSYRIQAALFGTSTRMYFYMHKGESVRSAWASVIGRRVDGQFVAAEQSTDLPEVTARIPVAAAGESAALDRANPLLLQLAQAFRERGKRIVIVQIADYAELMPEPMIAAFNAAFAPNASVAIVDRLPAARLDTIHFNREGAAAAAQALRHLVDERR